MCFDCLTLSFKKEKFDSVWEANATDILFISF